MNDNLKAFFTKAVSFIGMLSFILNITVRRSRQSGVARATCPD